ncbi:hypothetical protein [Candidatus Methylacidithermus pantelleriae]|uniref:Uncharacterized protein n=1 Tax=Candidatus Methylacidithermus pantelleriae TaxID=2744239 RepID=A0A8J2BN76_9BACT|nr:hypothetical protein [Candidatus Methylacidithermus pantelleriae]CAF0692939.1 hypothetical protein MPNT_130017 [Candidatus Methylacidithermus pantelleriae]
MIADLLSRPWIAGLPTWLEPSKGAPSAYFWVPAITLVAGFVVFFVIRNIAKKNE